MNFLNDMKTLPALALGYFKEHRATLDSAKKDRRIASPILFILVFFASGIALVGGLLSSMQTAISRIRFNKLSFSDVSFSSFKRAALFGVMLTATLIVCYLLTRLVCIKIFTVKSKKVMLESFIECSLHLMSVSVIFLFGGLLSLLHWLFPIAALLFGVMYLFIALILGIAYAVGPEKVKPRFFAVAALFASVSFICIFVVAAMIELMIAVGILKCLVGNLNDFIDEVEEIVAMVLVEVANHVDL